MPLALAAYFLWRSRTDRLFLFGIPFLQMMRYSIFFEKLRPFWMPGRLGPLGDLMLWMVIAWLYCVGVLFPRTPARRSGSLFGPPLRLPEEGLLLALAALVFGQIILTWASGVDPFEVVSQSTGMICAFVGYALVRGAVSHAKRETVASFLKALVFVTVLATTLFVVHQGLHIKVYSLPEYITFVYGGTLLTRSFLFMPPLLVFAGAWLMARRRFGPLVALGLVVVAAAVVVSYTRILMAAFLVELCVVFTLTWVRTRRLRLPFMHRLARWVVAGVVLATILALVFPVGTRFALSRISPATSRAGLTSDTNYQGRVNRVAVIADNLSDYHLLVGGGFRRDIGGLSAQGLEIWSADMGWIQVFYRLGLLGLVLLCCVFAAYITRAVRLALDPDPWWGAWGLTWATALAGSVVAVLASWSFLWPEQLPLAFWMLAFVGACRPRRTTGQIPKVRPPRRDSVTEQAG